jgi:hypothetical protein
MALLEHFIAQLSANLLRFVFTANVRLAWMRNNFIGQEIARFFRLPFVGEWMDGRFDISCGMQKTFLSEEL